MFKERNNKKLKPMSIFIPTIIFPTILLCITLFTVYNTGKYQNWNNSNTSQTSSLIFNKSSDKNNSEIPIIRNMISKNAILVENSSGKIIAQKNKDAKCYPASLTKIMTTIVAIENLNDLDVEIPMKSSIFESLKNSNASMAGFLPDEKAKAKDALYGIMLPSGAESSLGVAEYISGSEDKFVDLMNKKARELGMKNTHYSNTIGLHNSDHYTTAYDLSILLDYALENDIFKSIFTTDRYSTSPTNLNSAGITFRSTTFDKIDNENFGRGKVIGGKTGFTDKAGLCLASLLEKNGKEYILITTGAEKTNNESSSNIIDAFNIYDTYFH